MYWPASVVHHVHSVVLEHYNRRTSAIVNRGLVALTFVFLFWRSIKARETYIASSLVGRFSPVVFFRKSWDVTSRDLREGQEVKELDQGFSFILFHQVRSYV